MESLKYENSTANEIIEHKSNMIAYEMARQIVKLNHMNKLFAPLETQGFIKYLGKDEGEKVWQLTSDGLKALEDMDEG